MTNDTSENAESGTGWIDQPDDANVIAALVEKIKAQQATIAASSKTHLDGRIDRGQHQKQTLGAFGTLRIFDTIPPALQQGPFAKENALAPSLSYRVACRFSKASRVPFPTVPPTCAASPLLRPAIFGFQRRCLSRYQIG